MRYGKILWDMVIFSKYVRLEEEEEEEEEAFAWTDRISTLCTCSYLVYWMKTLGWCHCGLSPFDLILPPSPSLWNLQNDVGCPSDDLC